MIPQQFRLKNTIKFPTSLIVGGMNRLGLEIAESLMEQGGYVIIVDTTSAENIEKISQLPKKSLISFLDYTSIPHLEEDIRRLDYVFYFGHESLDFKNQVSTQDFLRFSNYLDAVLALSTKFDAKFLLTTAIKANQMMLSEQQLQGLDYGVSYTAKHTTYTEMEIQRYAEGLTFEYFQKVNLDTRVVRLGEIIGEGIDFAKESAFNKLILEAVRGEKLTLINDGLENEWYVHVLDASYALIKAQFSKNTSGKTFSVCYENSFTHLSVAYKIQEVDENIKEIQFADGEKNYLPLKIYKPAPNLATIGWMPRVPFDRAVKQSIASAKLYLVENSHQPQNLTLNNVSNNQNRFQDLLNSRRNNENQRKQSIVNASQSIMSQRVRRQKSSSEKFQDIFWNLYTSLSKIFKVFQRKSPLELAGYFFVIIFGIFFYITILSPILVVSKNLVIVIPEQNNLVNAFNNNNIDGIIYSSKNIDSAVQEIKQVIPKTKFLFDFFTLDEQYSQIEKVIDNYSLVSSGFNDISIFLDEYNNYINNFEPNIQFRNTTDGYLSVINSNTDLSSILNRMKEKSIYLESGNTKISTGIKELESTNFTTLPSFVANPIITNISFLQNNRKNLESIKLLKSLPEILGVEEEKNHIILVLDNTRLSSQGGDISAYILVQMNKGNITSIRLESINSIESNYKVTNDELNLINQPKTIFVTEQNFSAVNLQSITDFSEFSKSSRELFEETFGIDIDGIATINLETFEKLVKEVSKTESFIINGYNFNSSNSLLTDINSSLSSNQSLAARKDTIAQISALTTYSIFNNLSKFFPLLSSSLNNSEQNSNLNFDFENPDFRQQIKTISKDFVEDENTDFYIKPVINLNDPSVVDIDRYLNSTVSVKSTFSDDLSLIQEISIKFPNITAAQDISVCAPSKVIQSSIQLTNLSQTALNVNSYENEICATVRPGNASQINLEWKTVPLFNKNNNTIDFTLNINNIKGTSTVVDSEIVAPAGYQISKSNLENASLSTNSLIYSATQNFSKTFTIEFSK